MEGNILLLGDGSHLFRAMSWVLESKDYRVERALESEAAVEAVVRKNFDLIIVKLTPEETEVLDVLNWARRLNPGVKIVAISRPQDQPFPWEAYHIDLDDYILLPISAGELWRRVNKCLEQASGADPKTGAASPGPAGEDWAARSLGMISDNLKSSLIATLGAVKLILQGAGAKLEKARRKSSGKWGPGCGNCRFCGKRWPGASRPRRLRLHCVKRIRLLEKVPWSR